LPDYTEEIFMTTDTNASAQSQELRSVYTAGLPEIFAQLNISLVVSTYQAGKVILVRHDPGAPATVGNHSGGDNSVGTLNTHFRAFQKPMGVAVQGNKLAIGGQKTVWELHNMPVVARKLEPVGKHDACYLPRRIQITGDIDIHEMAFASDGELWLVNTRFGCLCTLDAAHSFHPRWRPPFLTAYAPEDRCHLNGLAMVDGRPKYVTALGETDTTGGWRANKANGGLLMDVETNEILLRGLSMPHSPRWYNNQLYVLESGQGSLATVDLEAARNTRDIFRTPRPEGTRPLRTICQLPGFTRGLDFYGPLAFIGLSQVRETATFSGLPLMERLGEERTCGVWVVHIETGQTLGFLRFEAGVQEIFAVQVLPNTRFPEMLEWEDERLSHSYVLPDAALAETPLAERA
jgi:uncharacterized protein (TIGR03032 family)